MDLRKRWKYIAGACIGLLVLGATTLYTFFPDTVLSYFADKDMEKLQMEPKNIYLNGNKIHYVEGGTGKETLVLVHGFRSSKSYWIAYLPEFLSHYHVIAVDLPGHGASGRGGSDQHYDLRAMGAFLAQFIDALNLKNIYLVGTSMGGGVAFSYATEHSDNIKAMALINPLAVHPPKLSEVHEALSRGENLLLPKDMAGFKTMQEVVYGSELNLNPVLSKLILNALVQNRDFYLHAFNEMVEKGGLEDVLSKVKKPTLILQSDKDRVVDPSGIKVIKELVPEAKIVWVEGGAHTLRGHLREFAQENILEFLHEQGACKGCVVAASE
jgi:abhydrolase domain-containing protein 6